MRSDSFFALSQVWERLGRAWVEQIGRIVDGDQPEAWAAGLDLWAGIGGAPRAILEYCPDSRLSGNVRESCLAFAQMIRRCISASDSTSNLGLFGGLTGLLLVATELETMLVPNSDLSWQREAADLVEKRILDKQIAHNDFTNGIAGILCAILWLQKKLGYREEIVVRRLLEQLVDRLELTRTGLAMRSDANRDGLPLYGLAHGSCGAAVALIESSVFFASEELARMASSALERDLAGRTRSDLWPDMRDNVRGLISKTGQKSADELATIPSSGYMWCHGSPGIALTARLFYERLKDIRFRKNVLEIAAHTEDYIIGANSLGTDSCVCHGFASLCGLICCDGAWLASDRFKVILRNRMDMVIEGLHGALCTETRSLEEILPIPPGANRNSTVLKLSYYLGATGVCDVLTKAITNKPQRQLLLPIHI